MFRMIGVLLAAGCLLSTGTAPALAADGDSSAAALLVQKAKALRAEKNYEQAMKMALTAVQIDDDYEPGWAELAWLLNEKKDYDNAIKAALIAIHFRQSDSEAWRELGFALMKKGDNERAVEALVKAIDYDESNWTAYDYLAQALRNVGRDKEAAIVMEIKARRQQQGKNRP
jgi:tetratricopeptide (TPR) repeat protein